MIRPFPPVRIFLICEALTWLIPLRLSERYRLKLWQEAHAEEEIASTAFTKEILPIEQGIIQARRIIGRSSCLIEALTMRQMLRRRGIGAKLVLGAKLDGADRFEAHAWLEMEGNTVFGRNSLGSFKCFE